jgi:hypothetical protein
MLHACLYTICFAFCYTSWHFYAFCGTNLLTRCHRGNIIGIGWNKAEPPIFTEASQRPKMRRRGARGQAHHMVARPSPWPCHHMVRPPGPTSDAALSSLKSPRREKPKGRIAFTRNILQATIVVEARSGGSRSSSQHPAGGLLHHHGRLRSDVWVVYLGLRVHSSS